MPNLFNHDFIDDVQLDLAHTIEDEAITANEAGVALGQLVDLLLERVWDGGDFHDRAVDDARR